MKEKEMSEVAEFIKKVAMDDKDVTAEVSEYMSDYTTVHYAFNESDAYNYIQF